MPQPRALSPARDAWIAVAAGVLLVAWEWSGWDLVVVRRFGDAHGFAWRDAWLTGTLLHQGGRALAWVVLGLLAIDAWRPLVAGPTTSERRRWLLVSLACLLLIPALKRFSATSCPWDLLEFGGTAAYVPHWMAGIVDGGPGHCFPSGHAVAAFGFLPGYFLWREHRPALARGWLVAVGMAGAVFGAAQLSRGAHPPSHTLWSAWLCWVVCVGVRALGVRFAHHQLTGRRGIRGLVVSEANPNTTRRDITPPPAPRNAPAPRAPHRSTRAASPP